MVINRDDKQLVGVVSLSDLANNGHEKMSGSVLLSITSPLPE